MEHLSLSHELGEAAAGGHELRVGAGLLDAPVLHVQHPVRVARELQLVRDEHPRPAQRYLALGLEGLKGST